MKTYTTTLITILIFSLISFNLLGQVGQYISANGYPVVEDYLAEICVDSDVTLFIEDASNPLEEWTWYGPNGLYASGNSLYISSFSSNFEGIYEAVSNSGNFYHFELYILEDDFASFPAEFALLEGKSKRIYAPSREDGHTYTWSTGETTSSILVSPTKATIYSVTITTQYGCTDTADKMIYVAGSENYFVDDRIVCKRGNYFVEGPSGYSSYKWLSNGKLSKDIIIKPRYINFIQLAATKENGDIDFYIYDLTKIDCIEIENMTEEGIENQNIVFDKEDIDLEELFGDEKATWSNDEVIKESTLQTEVFPNPSSDILNVSIDDQDYGEERKISIINSSMNPVLEASKYGNDFSVDISRLPSGTYFLVVLSENKTTTQQFIVLK